MVQPMRPGMPLPVPQSMSMPIEIFVACRNLKNLETWVTESTQCKLFEFVGNQWVFRGQTEVFPRNLNPDYTLGIQFPFFFEKT